MSRNNSGEGSLSQRPDGRWQASLQVDGVRRVVYGKTEHEAKKKLRQLKAQAAKNNYLCTPGRRTVGDLLNQWLLTMAPTLRPRTNADYRWHVDKYILPSLGAIPLSRLSPAHVQKLYTELLNRGLSRGAVIVHCELHAAFRLAVQWRWLPDNPTDRVIKPKHQYKRMKIWNKDQLATFLAATEDHWLHPLWIVAIASGARISELVGLKWEDVDLVASTLRICRTLQRIGGQWVEGEPKTQAGRRTISLPPTAVEALKKQKAMTEERRLQAGPGWREDHGLVFTGEVGGPLLASTPEHALRRLCRKLGLPPVTPHGLRHLSASLLLDQGVPVTAVSRRLGHADAGITMKIYAHAFSHQDDREAQALQEALGAR